MYSKFITLSCKPSPLSSPESSHLMDTLYPLNPSSPFPSSPTMLLCISVLWLQIPRVKKRMQWLSFCYWLFPFSIMSSGFHPYFTCVRISFLLRQNAVCVYHSLLPVPPSLDTLPLWAVMRKQGCPNTRLHPLCESCFRPVHIHRREEEKEEKFSVNLTSQFLRVRLSMHRPQVSSPAQRIAVMV